MPEWIHTSLIQLAYIWNNLPLEAVHAHTINKFCKLLKFLIDNYLFIYLFMYYC